MTELESKQDKSGVPPASLNTIGKGLDKQRYAEANYGSFIENNIDPNEAQQAANALLDGEGESGVTPMSAEEAEKLGAEEILERIKAVRKWIKVEKYFAEARLADNEPYKAAHHLQRIVGFQHEMKLLLKRGFAISEEENTDFLNQKDWLKKLLD